MEARVFLPEDVVDRGRSQMISMFSPGSWRVVELLKHPGLVVFTVLYATPVPYKLSCAVVQRNIQRK